MNLLPTSFLAALCLHSTGFGPPGPATVASGLLDLMEERRLDGLSLASLRGSYVWPAAAILRLIPPRLPLADLRFDAMRAMCLRGLDAGYAPQTIREKHLGLCRAVLHLKGVVDETPEVRRRLASRLRGRSIPIPIFTADDMSRLWTRIESYPSKRILTARRREMAVLRLAGLRAIRCLELSRVRVEDVDFPMGILFVRDAKDPDHPRAVLLDGAEGIEAIREDCRVLIAGRTTGQLVPGGVRKIRRAAETWQRRLEEPRITMRNLRRSCASALDAQGASIAVIRDVLGHARNSQQTLRYLETTQERLRFELGRLDRRASPQSREP